MASRAVDGPTPKSSSPTTNPPPAGREEREAFVVAHLPLVRHVLNRLPVPHGGPLSTPEDLYAFGVLGLVQAVESFDPDRGVAFASYAFLRIRGAIVDAARRNDRLSRVDRRTSIELATCQAELTARFGREPTRDELLRASGLTRDRFEALRLAERRTMLAERVAGEDTFEDQVVDESLLDPLERLERMELLEVLAQAVRRLPERQRFVLALYYQEGLARREIADILGLSKSRIDQILFSALTRLRANSTLARAA